VKETRGRENRRRKGRDTKSKRKGKETKGKIKIKKNVIMK
jgi:hypothetical protein